MDLVDTIQTQGPESGWHISVVQLVHLAVQLAAVCLKYIQYPAHSPGGSSCSVHMAKCRQPFGCVLYCACAPDNCNLITAPISVVASMSWLNCACTYRGFDHRTVVWEAVVVYIGLCRRHPKENA